MQKIKDEIARLQVKLAEVDKRLNDDFHLNITEAFEKFVILSQIMIYEDYLEAEDKEFFIVETMLGAMNGALLLASTKSPEGLLLAYLTDKATKTAIENIIKNQ